MSRIDEIRARYPIGGERIKTMSGQEADIRYLLAEVERLSLELADSRVMHDAIMKDANELSGKVFEQADTNASLTRELKRCRKALSEARDLVEDWRDRSNDAGFGATDVDRAVRHCAYELDRVLDELQKAKS